MIATRGPWQADAVVVGEGHAPVVAVLHATVKVVEEYGYEAITDASAQRPGR
jgi:hypothetical protein